MHRYYLSETPANHFSSLALFENITKITTPGLSTPQFSRSSEDLLNNPSINLEVSSQSSLSSSFCGDLHGIWFSFWCCSLVFHCVFRFLNLFCINVLKVFKHHLLVEVITKQNQMVLLMRYRLDLQL